VVKSLLGALLLALALVAPASVSATHSPGDGPNLDKVDGTVEDVFPSTLHVNAVSDPDGSNPRGQLWYTADNPGFTVDVAGEVTCVNVVMNLATVGMRIDRSKLPGFPGVGNGFLFVVQDFGEPGAGDPPTQLPDSHLDIPLTTPPTTCPSPFIFTFGHDHGNFVVHDAT
jgi:hypothetical protein